MDLSAIEALMKLMQQNGASYVETPELKIVLRPTPTAPVAADDSGPPIEKRRSVGLGPAYDHRSLGLDQLAPLPNA